MSSRSPVVHTPGELVERVVRTGLARGSLVFALDYDGTLVPLAERPELARADAELQSILASLADRPRCRVAVVSGRTLQDLRSVLGPPGNLFLFAEHGAVGYDPQSGEFFQGSRTGAAALEAVRTLLGSQAWPSGAWIEGKQSSVALHTRASAAPAADRAERLFRDAVRAVDPSSALALLRGKRVIEARLPGVHKGLAIRRLRENAPEAGSTLIAAGDDRTDEDAFRALEPGDFGIRIGDDPGETAARFALADPGQLRQFLVDLSFRMRGAPVGGDA